MKWFLPLAIWLAGCSGAAPEIARKEEELQRLQSEIRARRNDLKAKAPAIISRYNLLNQRRKP